MLEFEIEYSKNNYKSSSGTGSGSTTNIDFAYLQKKQELNKLCKQSADKISKDSYNDYYSSITVWLRTNIDKHTFQKTCIYSCNSSWKNHFEQEYTPKFPETLERLE